MREDYTRAAISQAVPARALRRLEERRRGGGGKQRALLSERVRSSTTIAAMVYRDGVLCVADRKMSGWGYSIMSQSAIKIDRLSGYSVLLGSGAVTDIQLACETIQNVNSEFEEDHDAPLSVAGQAHCLATAFRFWSEELVDGMNVSVILAGFDAHGPAIFGIEGDGTTLKHSEYNCTGSGGSRIEDQFDARWEPNLSFEQALATAMHGMIHSGMRDSATSPPIIALPTVVTVTAKGVATIPERTVERSLGQALLTKRGVRKSFARALIGGKK